MPPNCCWLYGALTFSPLTIGASGGAASRSPGRIITNAEPLNALVPVLVIMLDTPAEWPPNSAENWLVMSCTSLTVSIAKPLDPSCGARCSVSHFEWLLVPST